MFQYDEIYDAMENKRNESKLSRQDLEKKPKYINKLLQAADKRKRENERRIERQVQKEREAEGDEFKDKEAFVTTAYRNKLEELKKLDEEEKREEYLEKIGDVTKQGNLDGFYRHLYDQQVNTRSAEETGECSNTTKEEETGNDNGTTESSATKISEPAKRSHSTERDSLELFKRKETDTHTHDENGSESAEEVSKYKKRKYRIRENNDSEDVNENEIKIEHLPSNLDADSDFSIDSSDSDEPDDEIQISNLVIEDKSADNETKDNVDKEENTDRGKINNNDADQIGGAADAGGGEGVTPEPSRPNVDIWKKRTVGVVFDEAVQRYFERKAQRPVDF